MKLTAALELPYAVGGRGMDFMMPMEPVQEVTTMNFESLEALRRGTAAWKRIRGPMEFTAKWDFISWMLVCEAGFQ